MTTNEAKIVKLADGHVVQIGDCVTNVPRMVACFYGA